VLARYLELRACELAGLHRGTTELVASARCSQYEAKLSAEEPKQVPPTMSFGKGQTVELVARLGGRVKKSDSELASHFGSHCRHVYDYVPAASRGSYHVKELTLFTLPILEMARNVVMSMTDDSNNLLWPWASLLSRHKKSRTTVNLCNWTPATNALPLSDAEKIMQGGWNMGTATFYQHVDYNGIRFRTEYRDRRPKAKSHSCGVRVTTELKEMVGVNTTAFGKIQHIFSYKPFRSDLPGSPTYHFASCLFADPTRTVQHKWRDPSVVINLFSHSNTRDRVVLISQFQPFNLFWLPVHAEDEATALKNKSGRNMDSHYHVLSMSRNDHLPSKYYTEEEEEEEKERKEKEKRGRERKEEGEEEKEEEEEEKDK